MHSTYVSFTVFFVNVTSAPSNLTSKPSILLGIDFIFCALHSAAISSDKNWTSSCSPESLNTLWKNIWQESNIKVNHAKLHIFKHIMKLTSCNRALSSVVPRNESVGGSCIYPELLRFIIIYKRAKLTVNNYSQTYSIIIRIMFIHVYLPKVFTFSMLQPLAATTTTTQSGWIFQLQVTDFTVVGLRWTHVPQSSCELLSSCSGHDISWEQCLFQWISNIFECWKSQSSFHHCIHILTNFYDETQQPTKSTQQSRKRLPYSAKDYERAQCGQHRRELLKHRSSKVRGR